MSILVYEMFSNFLIQQFQNVNYRQSRSNFHTQHRHQTISEKLFKFSSNLGSYSKINVQLNIRNLILKF